MDTAENMDLTKMNKCDFCDKKVMNCRAVIGDNPRVTYCNKQKCKAQADEKENETYRSYVKILQDRLKNYGEIFSKTWKKNYEEYLECEKKKKEQYENRIRPNKCVVATHFRDERFTIPHGIDLENKDQVKEWYVKYGKLTIHLTNGEKLDIDQYHYGSAFHKTKETEVKIEDDYIY